MADWQTPKTDWGVEPFGPGDFNRMEGNIKVVGDWMSIAKGSEKYILPSDDVIMSAPTTRYSKTTSYGGRYEWTKLKRFKVKYEGLYRVEFEMRNNRQYDSGDDWESYYCPYAGVGVEEISENTPVRTIKYEGSYSTTYTKYNLDVYVPAGGVIFVSAGHEDWRTSAYIRNVKVKGTITTRDSVPDNAVLQN